MKFLKYLLTISLTSVTSLVYSQATETTINADPNIDILLKEKIKKENLSKYKIQLYYGNLTKAHSILNKFNNKYSEWDGKINYETPNYKVWVGNYQTRIEADRALLEINKNFPHAFIFKPEK